MDEIDVHVKEVAKELEGAETDFLYQHQVYRMMIEDLELDNVSMSNVIKEKSQYVKDVSINVRRQVKLSFTKHLLNQAKDQ